jgi:hypothetical protein
VIPSIDYLTLVLAGAALARLGLDQAEPNRLETALFWVGVWLFVSGTVLALKSAVGL